MSVFEKLYHAIKHHCHICDQYIKAAGRHGGDGGFNGFIYEEDTDKFYRENEELIFEMLSDDAAGQGLTVPQLMSSWAGNGRMEYPGGFRFMICVVVLERVGQWLEDKEDEA